jgi:hypothetical protein
MQFTYLFSLSKLQDALETVEPWIVFRKFQLKFIGFFHSVAYVRTIKTSDFIFIFKA